MISHIFLINVKIHRKKCFISISVQFYYSAVYVDVLIYVPLYKYYTTKIKCYATCKCVKYLLLKFMSIFWIFSTKISLLFDSCVLCNTYLYIYIYICMGICLFACMLMLVLLTMLLSLYKYNTWVVYIYIYYIFL